jgi:hypothetical protein
VFESLWTQTKAAAGKSTKMFGRMWAQLVFEDVRQILATTRLAGVASPPVQVELGQQGALSMHDRILKEFLALFGSTLSDALPSDTAPGGGAALDQADYEARIALSDLVWAKDFKAVLVARQAERKKAAAARLASLEKQKAELREALAAMTAEERAAFEAAARDEDTMDADERAAIEAALGAQGLAANAASGGGSASAGFEDVTDAAEEGGGGGAGFGATGKAPVEIWHNGELVKTISGGRCVQVAGGDPSSTIFSRPESEAEFVAGRQAQSEQDGSKLKLDTPD